MSDGLDPRHGPYRGKQPSPDLEKWCEEFVFELSKRGMLVPDVWDKTVKETKTFAEQLVRATRDGNFTEVK